MVHSEALIYAECVVSILDRSHDDGYKGGSSPCFATTYAGQDEGTGLDC
jgi:hypothetical protein